MLRQAVRLNSLSELAITKLDILDTLDTVKVCVAYDVDGERVHATCRTTSRPAQGRADLRGAAGLEAPTSPSHRDATSSRRRPRDYLAFLEDQVGVPIRLVGVGPGREQFVHRTRDLTVERRDRGSRVKVVVVGSGGREHALAVVLGRTAEVRRHAGQPRHPRVGRHAGRGARRRPRS